MKKKFLCLTLAMMFIAALCLAGCGGSSSSQNDPLADGVLKIGTNDTYVPLEYRDNNNNLVGFDIDLGNAIGDALGVKVEWVSTAWDGIFNGLDAGQYDCILSGTSITEERKKAYSMSDPYLSNGIVIVSRNDGTPATQATDLNGKKVGVQLETTADIAAQAMIDKEGNTMQLNKYDAMLDAFAALEGKSIDYIMTDEPVGEFYTSLKPDVYSVTSGILTNEPIGITSRKGDTDFAKKLNDTLKQLQDNGKMAELSQKWFHKDSTKNIDTTIKTIE